MLSFRFFVMCPKYMWTEKYTMIWHFFSNYHWLTSRCSLGLPITEIILLFTSYIGQPAWPLGAPRFTPVFSWVPVAQSWVFCALLCRSIFFFGHFIVDWRPIVKRSYQVLVNEKHRMQHNSRYYSSRNFLPSIRCNAGYCSILAITTQLTQSTDETWLLRLNDIGDREYLLYIDISRLRTLPFQLSE